MDIFFQFLCCIIRLLDNATKPLFNYLAKGKKKVVPPIKNPLLKISATELAEKIRKRQLSSTEICKAYIERIKEVNPIINAVVEDRFNQALKEAKLVDDYLTKCSLNESELEIIKPLLGVPFTVKESCSIQGQSLSVGTIKRMGFKSDQDGEIVSRLRSSGAIPLLVSNTPEICLSWESTNKITGTAKNPYDSTCTSAGSSGGEGALLGSGASVVGIGSDIAGSVRLPGLFNGVFGHKPTPRIAPIKGHYPYCNDSRYADFLVIGPMTRYAKDLKLMLKIMVGGKLSSELKLHDEMDLSKINVFFMEEIKTICIEPVQNDIKNCIHESVEHLRRKGSKIQDYKFDNLTNVNQICGSVIYSLEDIPNLLKGEDVNLLAEFIRSLSGNSKITTHLLYFYIIQGLFKQLVDDHFQDCVLLRKNFIEKLGDDGVLILPTWPTTAFKHNQFFFKSHSLAYLVIANGLGLPSTHVPCGLNKKGMPIGLQVLAAPQQDRLCLAVAEELERCFGGWTEPK